MNSNRQSSGIMPPWRLAAEVRHPRGGVVRDHDDAALGAADVGLERLRHETTGGSGGELLQGGIGAARRADQLRGGFAAEI